MSMSYTVFCEYARVRFEFFAGLVVAYLVAVGIGVIFLLAFVRGVGKIFWVSF